jgi:regulator of replication initiation timing
MSLLDKINRLEQTHKVFLDALNALKFDVKALEDENKQLYAQLGALSGSNPEQIGANASSIRRTARENLRRLYEERFHVCHLYFGQPRMGECLFCLSVLDGGSKP